MKRAIIVTLASALLLPLVISGCAIVAPASTDKSPANGGTPIQTVGITITADDFAKDAHPVMGVTLYQLSSLAVTLGANPSTGYSWTENAIISAPVVSQASYEFLEPTSTLVGAPGNAVWVFSPEQAGTATISFIYSRPWDSTPPPWTLTLNVTVR